MRRLILGLALAALAGCGDGSIPPELACLHRATDAMTDLAATRPTTEEERVAYMETLISIIDGLDQQGCSEETRNNLAGLREAATTIRGMLGEHRVAQPTIEQQAAADTAGRLMLGATEGIATELERRQREFDGN